MSITANDAGGAVAIVLTNEAMSKANGSAANNSAAPEDRAKTTGSVLMTLVALIEAAAMLAFRHELPPGVPGVWMSTIELPQTIESFTSRVEGDAVDGDAAQRCRCCR